MGRRTAREEAMKLLYQSSINLEDVEEQMERVLTDKTRELNESDHAYIKNVVNGTLASIVELDKKIESKAIGWKMNRMSKIDLSILRLCIYEITNREDVPVSVGINEAVEMAKKFSGSEAGAFVNGVLSNIAKDCSAGS